MRRTVVVSLASVVAALLTGPSSASLPDLSASAPLAGSTCQVFPADNYWHADIRGLPKHPLSDQWLAHMSSDNDLHPDFGDRYGIPITVVGGRHKRVRVKFLYADESDRVRYPLGRDTRIEGGRSSDGDRHAIVVNRKTCRLYETYATQKTGGAWRAGSGATWSLRANSLRPDGWTSSDAAGLPILPGLLRWDEVRERRVDHALRFTTDVTSRWHLWPARHDAGSQASHDYPPMGARFRLDPSLSTAGYGADAAEVIRAMQTYGLVLADNGSPWFFQGEQNQRWPNRLIEDLKQIPASAFVAVDTAPLKVSADSAAVR